MKSPVEIKLGLAACSADECHGNHTGCPYKGSIFCIQYICGDAMLYIQQLEEDKKRLQERICNQRRQLRVLHAMYEWALSVLQKAHMNDRAKLQAWLRKRGYELGTFELPESKYQQLERERDAAVRDMTEISNVYGICYFCKRGDEKHLNVCNRFLNGMDCWEWRGAQEVE